VKESLLKVSSPWWFWAIFSLIFGFGSVQDNAKRLSAETD
jgi:hypothetical protein